MGDLITADHKVLGEGCESRNNHRYAVVVQHLATQRIQSYPCKAKNFSGNTKGACKSSWSRIGSPKSFTLTIPWNLAKPCCRMFPGIIVRPHHTDRKQMGFVIGQYAEWKKAPLPYCCNQVWMKNGGQVPLECYTYLRNVQDLLSDGKTPCERRFGIPFNGPVIPFGTMVE